MEPSEVSILKFSGLISLMCISPLNLQPKCLKKNIIDGENVNYFSHLMCFKTKHSARCMVLIIPDHP